MQHSHHTLTQLEDEYLFGWDDTPGIVSVWASRAGEAIIWRREGERVTTTRERFRPWLFATSLQDLAHVGASLDTASSPGARITRTAARGFSATAEASDGHQPVGA